MAATKERINSRLPAHPDDRSTEPLPQFLDLVRRIARQLVLLEMLPDPLRVDLRTVARKPVRLDPRMHSEERLRQLRPVRVLSIPEQQDQSSTDVSKGGLEELGDPRGLDRVLVDRDVELPPERDGIDHRKLGAAAPVDRHRGRPDRSPGLRTSKDSSAGRR